MARRPNQGRLRALPETPSLQASDRKHVDADPHRRGTLSAGELHGADQDPGGKRAGGAPEDVGGIAELKWIAEYADLHGILVAPQEIFDGLFGVAAQVHMGATLPQNYIAFEYAKGQPEWWYDIVDGLPDPIVKNGFIDVWDKPGLGIIFRVQQSQGAPLGRGSRLL
jgi:Enolase C-terminal domain-like